MKILHAGESRNRCDPLSTPVCVRPAHTREVICVDPANATESLQSSVGFVAPSSVQVRLFLWENRCGTVQLWLANLQTQEIAHGRRVARAVWGAHTFRAARSGTFTGHDLRHSRQPILAPIPQRFMLRRKVRKPHHHNPACAVSLAGIERKDARSRCESACESFACPLQSGKL